MSEDKQQQQDQERPEQNSHDKKPRLWDSVFVNNLPRDITQSEIQAYFSSAGEIVTAQLEVDPITFECCACLKFATVEAAQRAIAALHQTVLKGEAIQVTEFKRDPELGGTVSVKNVDDQSGSGSELEELFASLDLDEITNEEKLQEAVAELNDKRTYPKHTVVESAKSDRVDPKPVIYNDVCIKNLAKEVTKDHLKELMAPFGVISKTKLWRKEDDNAMGIGFVSFEDPAAASKAVAELHELIYRGQRLYAYQDLKKEERIEELEEYLVIVNNKNVFVKYIEPCVTNMMLKEAFSAYGIIQNFKIFRKEKLLCDAIIRFATFAGAARALIEMQGRVLGTQSLGVSCAFNNEYFQRENEGASRRPLVEPFQIIKDTNEHQPIPENCELKGPKGVELAELSLTKEMSEVPVEINQEIRYLVYKVAVEMFPPRAASRVTDLVMTLEEEFIRKLLADENMLKGKLKVAYVVLNLKYNP